MSEQLWYLRMIGGTHRDLQLPYTPTRTIDLMEFSTFWIDGHENEGKFEIFFNKIDNELIFEALSKSSDNWIELIQIHDDNELLQQFKYSDTKGKRYYGYTNIIISHVINHSTHHRGQISGVITNLSKDFKPIQLDLAYWDRLNEQNTKQTTNTLQ